MHWKVSDRGLPFIFIKLTSQLHYANYFVRFTPRQANSFCSSAVTDSLTRAVTYSFGSICLGSLLTAILQVMVDHLRSLRRQPRCGLFYCIIAFFLHYLERLLEYFNKWAYVVSFLCSYHA